MKPELEQYDDFARLQRPQSNTLIGPQPTNLLDGESNRGPPAALSEARLQKYSADGGLSGAQGRAMLHDLDQKFGEQDRMMKFLQNQLATLEDQLAQSKEMQLKMRDDEMG